MDLDTANLPFCRMVRTKGFPKSILQENFFPQGWEQAFPEHMWETLPVSEGQAVILRGSWVLPGVVLTFPLSLHLLAVC